MGNYCSGSDLRPVGTMSNRPRLGYDFQKTSIHSDRFGEVLFTRKKEQQYNFMMSVRHDGALEQISVDMVILKELVDCVLFQNYDLRFQNKTVIDIFDMADHSQVLMEAVHRRTGQPFSAKFYPFTSYNDHIFKKGLYEVFMHGLLGNFARGILNLVDYFVVDRSQQKALVFLYEPVETSLANIIEYRNTASQPWSEVEQQYIMHSILAGYQSLNRKNIYHRDLRPSRIYYSKYKKEYLIGNLEEARVVMAVDLQRDAMLTPRGVPFFNSQNMNEILRRNDRVGHYNALQNDYIFLKKLLLYISNTSYEDNHNSLSHQILEGIYEGLHTLQPIQEVLTPIRHIDFKIEETNIAESINTHLVETNARVNKVLLLEALYYMHHNEQYSRLAHQQIEENIELGRPLLNAEIFYRLGEYYASSGANSEDYFINAMKLFIRRSIYNRRMGFIGRSMESLREAKKCYDFVLDFNYKVMYLGQMAVVKANLSQMPEANNIIQEAMTQAATRGIPPLQQLDLLLNKGEVCIFGNDVDNCQKHMKFGLTLCEDREYFNDLRHQGEYKAKFLTLMGISYVGECLGKDTFVVQQTGLVDNRMKHLAKAESFLLSALEMSEVSPSKNIEMSTILYYLGMIYQVRGDFYQAKKSFVRALEFRLAYKEEISPPLVAQVFYKVATCHRLLGEFTQAERHYISALRILSLVPDLRQEAMICQAYLGITLIRQGRVEDGMRQFNLAQQTFGGQLPPQIAMEFQQAQAQGQPLAAMESQIRTTVRPPPGVLSTQHTNSVAPTSIIQTVTQEIIQPFPPQGIMGNPAMSMAMGNQMGMPMQPPPMPPPGIFGQPGSMFQSQGRNPVMESRVMSLGQPQQFDRTGSQINVIGALSQAMSQQPPQGLPMGPPLGFPMGPPPGFPMGPPPGMPPPGMPPGNFMSQPPPMQIIQETVQFQSMPLPPQMFNQQPPSQMFGQPPSQMYNQPPQGMGSPPMQIYEETTIINEQPPSRFNAPPPPQMIFNLPRQSEIRQVNVMPPPLINPTYEVPVPQPPPGFFESMMGVTPGSQINLNNLNNSEFRSGIRQTEIDVTQERDASGTHRNIVITLPNQPSNNEGNDIVINLGNQQKPSSTIYGSSSNIRVSRTGQQDGNGFSPLRIVNSNAENSNLYQPPSGENMGSFSNLSSNGNFAPRNVMPLNSNGGLASSSLIRVPVP